MEDIHFSDGLGGPELREFFQSKFRKAIPIDVAIDSDDMQQLENAVRDIEQVGALLERGIDHLQKNPLSRRAFCKMVGVSGFGLAAFRSLCFPEAAEAMGCASGLKETRQAVIAQRWKSKIPIPKDGCYVGGHELGFGVRDYESLVADYAKKIGKLPAFFDISSGKYEAVNDDFPQDVFNVLWSIGVLPEIKYGVVPFTSFRDIAKGQHDDHFLAFSEKAAEYGKPYFFVPFKEINMKQEYWLHGGQPPEWFVEASRHMHDVFERQGAVQNTIWVLSYLGIKYNSAIVRTNLESFYPGDDVVDWICFTIVNRVRLGQPWTHFREMFRKDYEWTRENHSSIPIGLVEMAQSLNSKQYKFIRQAYKDLKEEFLAVKMVQWWEAGVTFKNGRENQFFSWDPKSVEAMREVHSDPYFIGGPLGFLEQYCGT